ERLLAHDWDRAAMQAHAERFSEVEFGRHIRRLDGTDRRRATRTSASRRSRRARGACPPWRCAPAATWTPSWKT
ncbi:hypothetical protein D9C01_12935, partial [Corynebacterium diphtheriae]